MQVGWVSPVHDRRIASYRYRVEAPAAGLKARGHSVEVFDPLKAHKYDVVVFSKAYAPEHRELAQSVKRRGGRVVFDLCDNHFYNPYDLPKYRRAREELGEMMALADRVVCSTPALAAVVREEIGGRLEPFVIGDIVERFRPRPREPWSAADPLRLTWFGSHGSPNAPSGMTDLLLIREALEGLAAHQAVELTVCSNNREKFEQSIAPLKIPTRYVEWSLKDFPRVLAKTDAAVLPMNINPFTACKTHNRLTTALYAGVPVIASGIESYREFDAYCTLDKWDEGFQAILETQDGERQRALASRRHIDQRWTIEALAAQWEAVLALPATVARKGHPLHAVRLQGRLDATAHKAVTGWVRLPLRPDIALQVVLECDGEPASVSVANQPREDIRQAGLESDCGFCLPLPAHMAGASQMRVRVLDTTWIVGENPILVGESNKLGFAAAALAAPAGDAHRAMEHQPEQRWDVADSISAQEVLLLKLKEERTAQRKAQTAATKAALAAEVRNSHKDIFQRGADTAH